MVRKRQLSKDLGNDCTRKKEEQVQRDGSSRDRNGKCGADMQVTKKALVDKVGKGRQRCKIHNYVNRIPREVLTNWDAIINSKCHFSEGKYSFVCVSSGIFA